MRKTIFRIILFLGIPFTFLSALWLWFVRKAGIGKIEDKIFMKVGVLPILDHYYHPLINPKRHLFKSLREDRFLPGIDFNTKEQLELLSKFNYNDELLKIPLKKTGSLEFYYNNDSYLSGDAEYLYNVVRHFKPKRIIEVGCGSSTLMIRNALVQNKIEDKNYKYEHICIEPYEQSWLESIEITLIREKIELVDRTLFKSLNENDILFIDSSHIIRPQGDVLYEFLEILPVLNAGVLVHVHDIFSPKDYLDRWIYEHVLWNEQYLLEAFLTFNNNFKIIGALNYLTHHYYKELSEKCPILSKQSKREPGAFWMVKV